MALQFEAVIDRLITLGYPVAQTEFTDTNQQPAPPPPFIVWLKAENIRGADAYKGAPSVLVCETNASIELYTDIAAEAEAERVQIERRIESEVLSGVDFEKFQAPIHKENLYQTAYEFKITQKRRM